MAGRKRNVNEGSDDDDEGDVSVKRARATTGADVEGDERAAAARLSKSTDGADSDDEDGEDGEAMEARASKYQLTEEDLHEELDTGFTDGGVEVTPFNLKREMEEGHFDEAGNYFEDKTARAGDEWLEGVAVYKGPVPVQRDDDEEEEDVPPADQAALMADVLKHLRPSETVAGALRRLGKESGKKEPGPDPKKSAEDLLALTAAADGMLGVGCYDIYQYTYEKLAFELESLKERTGARKSQASAADSEAPAEAGDAVMFEYKWSEEEGAETYGPFTAQQMQAWHQEGYFQEGAVCREVGKASAPFYKVARVDFDLYT